MARRIRDIREDELIEGAIRAISKSGYAQITLAGIGREVGASAPSINYYFGSKERLMEATMRRLLSLLQAAHVARLKDASGPRARLDALVSANFAARLFTPAQCAVWVQFWAAASYTPQLARLQVLNRARVRSHFRGTLRALVPAKDVDPLRRAMQAYMDGVWLAAAQNGAEVNAQRAEREALEFLAALLDRRA
ncbi:transcriptional regulator BetI [Pseudaestuariivita sp.]|uniref:transcriptional regulator BetI n=1 Tax=Pseudaestuariivita sp. TaxID=2211669 RepID=UPI004058A1DC